MLNITQSQFLFIPLVFYSKAINLQLINSMISTNKNIMNIIHAEEFDSFKTRSAVVLNQISSAVFLFFNDIWLVKMYFKSSIV